MKQVRESSIPFGDVCESLAIIRAEQSGDLSVGSPGKRLRRQVNKVLCETEKRYNPNSSSP